MPDAYQDGVFFHKSARILAMPDVRESLIAFYKLLKGTFPLEGMVMHHFLPSSQSPICIWMSLRSAASTSSGGSFRFPVSRPCSSGPFR